MPPEVLEDCRMALTLLEEERDYRRWRVHWAAAVALVRAVGHVLDKVDGKDPVRKRISASSVVEELIPNMKFSQNLL